MNRTTRWAILGPTALLATHLLAAPNSPTDATFWTDEPTLLLSVYCDRGPAANLAVETLLRTPDRTAALIDQWLQHHHEPDRRQRLKQLLLALTDDSALAADVLARHRAPHARHRHPPIDPPRHTSRPRLPPHRDPAHATELFPTQSLPSRAERYDAMVRDRANPSVLACWLWPGSVPADHRPPRWPNTPPPESVRHARAQGAALTDTERVERVRTAPLEVLRELAHYMDWGPEGQRLVALAQLDRALRTPRDDALAIGALILERLVWEPSLRYAIARRLNLTPNGRRTLLAGLRADPDTRRAALEWIHVGHITHTDLREAQITPDHLTPHLQESTYAGASARLLLALLDS